MPPPVLPAQAPTNISNAEGRQRVDHAHPHLLRGRARGHHGHRAVAQLPPERGRTNIPLAQRRVADIKKHYLAFQMEE